MSLSRRGLLALGGTAAAALLVSACAPSDTPDPACYTADGCSPDPSDQPADTLLDGVAEEGETQWQMVRRLWPDYQPSDLAFMVFDPERGYVFPDEADFDEDWNYTCVGGEKVLFLAATSV